MTLLTKTTLLYLMVALLIFGAGGVVAYQMIKSLVDKETDYFLGRNYKQVRKSIASGQNFESLNTETVNIERLPSNGIYDTTAHFRDTMEMHYYWKRLEPHRLLTKITPINNSYYRISLMDVIIESDDVYKGVLNILTVLFAGLCIAFLLFGYFMGRLLLSPFYKTLTSIRAFNVKEESNIMELKTNTKEFRQLNAFVYSMKDKARRDYIALKEFTENASHEMQTPVAIAKGKLELLMQSGNLTEKDIKLIHSAQDSISRLSRISQGLSLLNKIDNEEFKSHSLIDFSQILKKLIVQFEELAQLKGIGIKQDIQNEILLPVDENLAEILISNLLKNAIHHNEMNGWINIVLDHEKLLFTNSGPAPKVETSLLFERFKKGNQSGSSLGLGLAIVKKICLVNDWHIDYTYQEKQHELQVDFV